MLLINPKGEYPRHLGDLQLAHKSWQVGDALPAGWVEVKESDRPIAPDGQVCYEAYPKEINGVMTQTWEVRPMTSDELARYNAPKTAKEKLLAIGLNEFEIDAITKGLVR